MRTLTHKQRILMKVVERLSVEGKSSKFMLVKILFLLNHEENINKYLKFYNFFPYKYGPFSNMIYSDINMLEKEDFISKNGNGLRLTDKGKQAAKTANSRGSIKVSRTVKRFKSNRQIREYVYQKFPEFTVKSEIVPTINKQTIPGLSTIGYEGKDIDLFLNILINNQIDILIDVRKNPFSMNFSFTRNKLINSLEKVDIKYIHIPELGIDGKSRENLISRNDYENLFKKYEITTLKSHPEKLNHIMKLIEKNRVALLCFEADKDFCHRGIIAKEIEKQHGMGVTHL